MRKQIHYNWGRLLFLFSIWKGRSRLSGQIGSLPLNGNCKTLWLARISLYGTWCTLVSGEFAKVLSRLSVTHIPAPKAQPQSVGLAERYVKLLVDQLKVTVMGRKLPAEDWDLVLDSVIHAINTRVLSVHGFSPAELLLGYYPN